MTEGTMTEVFALTLEREARDWGQISFEVIGVFPNFDKALDHLKDIKNKEDELSDLSPHAIEISEKTANWWYRDWDGIYDYKIESVKYYEQ